MRRSGSCHSHPGGDRSEHCINKLVQLLESIYIRDILVVADDDSSTWCAIVVIDNGVQVHQWGWGCVSSTIGQMDETRDIYLITVPEMQLTVLVDFCVRTLRVRVSLCMLVSCDMCICI